MSEHKATPEQWDVVARLALSGSTWGSTIYELLFRLEALEAAQRPRVFTADEVAPIVTSAAPASSLVNRVAKSISHEGCIAWEAVYGKEARAAIREVAAAARLRDLNGQSVAMMTWEGVAQWLEQEADGG
jgi:hypothetical protein